MRQSGDRGAGARRQQGFTLLLVMLVLLVGGTSVYLSARDPAAARASQSLQRSALGLKEAATALAVYSISDDERPGSMPCPDFDADGMADVNCLSTADAVYIERLPWKTIDIDRDAGRLWYVMDSDFRDNSTAQPINVVVEGSLTLDGMAGYAALIIDPGDPLAGQTGRGSVGEAIGDYLDIPENTDGDGEYVDCVGVDGCNDRIIGITVDQLFQAVQQRVLAEIELALTEFHNDNGFLPFAANFGESDCVVGKITGGVATSTGSCPPGSHLEEDDMPGYVDPVDRGWLLDNDWLDHVVYAVDGNCMQGQSGCAFADYQLKSNSGLAVVLAGAGSEISGQDRVNPGSDIFDFLESGENTDGDSTFDDAVLSSADNDVLRGFALP